MIAMLPFAICIKEYLSAIDNMEHLLDIFQSVADFLDFTQHKITVRVYLYVSVVCHFSDIVSFAIETAPLCGTVCCV